MANMCSVCGGGIDENYTAPEARCTCFKKDQTKIDNMKHEVLVAEGRWLRANGWVPEDGPDLLKNGFQWCDEKGQGPLTHRAAVQEQQKRDDDPVLRKQFHLELRHQRTYSRLEKKQKVGADTTLERSELVTTIKLMADLHNRKTEKERGSPLP